MIGTDLDTLAVHLTGPMAGLCRESYGPGRPGMGLFAHETPVLNETQEGFILTFRTGVLIELPPGILGWVVASSGSVSRLQGARVMNSMTEPGETQETVVRLSLRIWRSVNPIYAEIQSMMAEHIPIAQMVFLPYLSPQVLLSPSRPDNL